MDIQPISPEANSTNSLNHQTGGDFFLPGSRKNFLSSVFTKIGNATSAGLQHNSENLKPAKRIFLFFIAGLLTITAAALFMCGVKVLIGSSVNITYPLFAGAVVILSIAGIFPAYRQLGMGQQFFTPINRSKFNSNDRIQADISEAATLDEVTVAIQTRIRAIIPARHTHIFTYDPEMDLFIASKIDGEQSSDLQFQWSSPLVQALSACKTHFIKNDRQHPEIQFPVDETRMELLGADAFFPLHGKEQLLGWIAVGRGLSQTSLSPKQCDKLEKVAGQAEKMIERFILTSRLERRMQQLDVLSRVAQGVNFTLGLDDIFELIYAQTIQILPADEFQILMIEPLRKNVMVAFSILGNERRAADEKQSIPGELLPEYDAICQGRPYSSRNYWRDRRKLGCQDREGGQMVIRLAVPLRAGAETIGAVCVGQRDPDSFFTTSQQELLQAVADQAAGAIVKARLLGESDKRTHQLRTLYDMTRQLTSTLDQELLLKNILQSAVEILECEAGSLLMADEQTNQLVYKVKLGPVSGDLFDQRMPAEFGIAGKSFHDCQPVIVNDVRDSSLWFAQHNYSTDIAAQSLLVVPMQVKDRVLGVIEVVNHKDGAGFNQDDQELLSAFAAQAAVAIENARLYTMTDQALAARVEELSVMQQIDRELNTSLDVNRAMNITLEWAMQQSGAAAGLIGMVEPDGIRLVASRGYGQELEEFRDNLLPVSKAHLDLLTEDGKPAKVFEDDSSAVLLQSAKSQVVIPIQRNQRISGLILLESNQPEVCSQDALSFLTRLGDHASIAIANAQLYNAVQAANLAKSEFVSFVAHELKNPMTSIKGYTELLAARAVGPVTETQASFLQVIRANIDRMNTLVSDLNDLSKIEAGRIRLDFSTIALKEIVGEVERSLRRQIEDKGLVFETAFPPDLPMVWSDKNRLVQILVNLVSNAQKYTQPGGKITLGAAVQSTQNDRDETLLHVWVQDNGIGITADDQTRIFQKFFRSDDPKTREAPGAGLGLNITRSLVEMQGGRIWFESEFRKGTTFHFTIPLAE